MSQSEKLMNGALVTSTPEENIWEFEDGIFKILVLNKNYCILIRILLEIIPNYTNDNLPALL